MKESAPRPDDEMHDDPQDLGDPGPLGEYLRLCRDQIVGPFDEADSQALRSQKLHRRITGLAAAFGGASLVAAAVNIAFLDAATELTLLVEASLAAVGTALVFAGLVKSWHGEWLLRRFQAEQLRLLKFRMLVDPDFWCAGGPALPGPRERLLRKIEEIQGIREKQLETFAAREGVPKIASAAECAGITRDLRLEILTYYRRRRLNSQITYFSRSGSRPSRWYQSSAILPFIFFTSVLCVGLHAWAEHAMEHRVGRAAAVAGERSGAPRRDPVEKLGRLALALSLALPGAWAGFRTWRTANEFGRNQSRSQARFDSLSKIAERLRPDASNEAVFADLGLSEHILAADQGEWLRLMRDADWYGG
ncbi:MAG: hypothetical protein ABI592_16275 [Acidobacteriota bacterium]